ncbi:MAG: hypothetical protein WA771_16385, partial [Chthoniobacterales bacterium]
ATSSTPGRKRGPKPGAKRGPKPGAKRGPKAKAEKAAKPAKAQSGKRGALKGQILGLLEKAGSEGMAVKDIAEKLGVKNQNVHVWFSTTGKKVDGLSKVGEARYALGGSAPKQSAPAPAAESAPAPAPAQQDAAEPAPEQQAAAGSESAPQQASFA